MPRGLDDMTPEEVSATMEALMTIETFPLTLSLAMTRRLASYAERTDADLKAADMEPLERDADGAVTTDALRHVIQGLIDRALEISETEAGLEAELDGTVCPKPTGSDS